MHVRRPAFLHLVERIVKTCLWNLFVLDVSCWIGWYAVMNGAHFSPVVLVLCFPSWLWLLIARVIPLWMMPPLSASGFITVAWDLTVSAFWVFFFFLITAWEEKIMSLLLIVSLTWARLVNRKCHWRWICSFAQTNISFFLAEIRPFDLLSNSLKRCFFQTLSLLILASLHPVTVGFWKQVIKSVSSPSTLFTAGSAF